MKQKESILDILIYLFESYMNSNPEISFLSEPDLLSDELEGAGFKDTQVTKAIQWLLELRDNSLNDTMVNYQPSLRFYSDDEKQRIDIELRLLINHMEREGIINAHTRELIIDRAMALHSDYLDLDHIKWIMLFVLCFQNNSTLHIQRLENVILMEASQGMLH